MAIHRPRQCSARQARLVWVPWFAHAVALASVWCFGASLRAQVHFVDATAAAGLNCTYASDPNDPNTVMAAGGAVGDFNRDGWQDLFVLGGMGQPDHLYINNHDGTFTDRAVQWGVARVARSLGVAVGDFNNDGWPDIFITVEPVQGGGAANNNVLYRNNGNGTFTDVAVAAGVAFVPGASIGGGWGAAFGGL